MTHVMDSPGGLSPLARRFLARRGGRDHFDPGPDDETCRALLHEVFGRSDEAVLAALRSTQERFGGLAYDSPFFGERITFDPVLDPDPGDESPVFDYAVQATTASLVGARLRPDGTVLIGWDTAPDVVAFRSLEHLVENDALMAAAVDLPLLDAEVATVAGVEALLAAHPRLAPLRQPGGFTEHWWYDGSVLAHVTQTWGRVFGYTGPQATLRVWAAERLDLT